MVIYIEELWKDNNNKKLINAIKKAYPNTDVYLNYISPFYSELVLNKDVTDGRVVRIYRLYDYDCITPNEFANLDYRSAIYFSDEKIKRIYITFMNNNFEGYKDNYLNNVSNKALENLGETSSI